MNKEREEVSVRRQPNLIMEKLPKASVWGKLIYKNKSTHALLDTLNKHSTFFIRNFSLEIWQVITSSHTKPVNKVWKKISEWIVPQTPVTVITESVKHYLLVHIWWYNYTPGHTLSQPAASSGLRTLRGNASSSIKTRAWQPTTR